MHTFQMGIYAAAKHKRSKKQNALAGLLQIVFVQTTNDCHNALDKKSSVEETWDNHNGDIDKFIMETPVLIFPPTPNMCIIIYVPPDRHYLSWCFVGDVHLSFYESRFK